MLFTIATVCAMYLPVSYTVFTIAIDGSIEIDHSDKIHHSYETRNTHRVNHKPDSMVSLNATQRLPRISSKGISKMVEPLKFIQQYQPPRFYNPPRIINGDIKKPLNQDILDQPNYKTKWRAEQLKETYPKPKTIQVNSLADIFNLLAEGLNFQSDTRKEKTGNKPFAPKASRSPNIIHKQNRNKINPKMGLYTENINLGFNFEIDASRQNGDLKVLKKGNDRIQGKNPKQEVTGIKTQRIPRRDATTISTLKPVTQHYMTTANLGLLDEPRRIKDVPEVSAFLDDIRRKTLAIFSDLLMNSTHQELKKTIDFLTKNYENKMNEYVDETKGHQIKTRSGPHKVMLNTIEYSHNIVNRLMNYLIVNADTKGLNSNAELSSKLRFLKSDVLRQLTIVECDSGMCPPKRGFHKLCMDLITILIATDESKIRQAFGGLQMVLKVTDFSDTVSAEVYEEFMEKVQMLQAIPTYLLKPSLLAVRNSLERHNKPMNSEGVPIDRLNKTSAFLAVIDSLSAKLDTLDNIEAETDKVRNAMQEWSQGKRDDIGTIATDFVNLVKMGTLLHKGESNEVANDLLGKVLFSEEKFRRWYQ